MPNYFDIYYQPMVYTNTYTATTMFGTQSYSYPLTCGAGSTGYIYIEDEKTKEEKKKKLELEQEQLKNEPTAFIVYTGAYLMTEERVLFDEADDANDYVNSLCKRYRLNPANFYIYEIYMKFFISGKIITESFNCGKYKQYKQCKEGTL